MEAAISAYVLSMNGLEISRQLHREFTLSQVHPAQSYNFSIGCQNQVASSARADVLTVLAAEAPARVKSLLITSQSSVGIGLSWEALPAGLNGGTPLTGYRIYVRELASAQNSPYITWGTTNSLSTAATVGTIVGGGQYCFKVAGMNVVTETNSLEDQSPRLSDGVCGYFAEPPDPPLAIYFLYPRPSEIGLFWPPSPNDQGSPIELYEVSVDSNKTGFRWISTNSATDLDHTFRGCTIGHTLDFRIRARNAVGWGNYSNIVSTMCATVPSQILGPRRIDSTRTSIHVRWDPPESNGADITAYRLYQAIGVGTFTKVYEGNSFEFNVVGLATGTTYRYAVTAVNEAGEGAQSQATPVLCAALPGPPVGISFTDDSRTDTVVSWTPPADDGGAEITRYEVWYRDQVGHGPINKLAWSGTGSFSDVLTFATGSSLQIQVASLNSINEQHYVPGTRSDPVVWHAAVLAGPPSVQVTESSLSSATLRWDPPSDSGGLPILGFIVRKDDALGGPLELAYNGSQSSFAWTGLATGYTYQFEVRALTAKGEGHPAVLSVVPCLAPSSVENFRVLVQTASLIRVSWKPPRDSGGCPVLGYIIFAGTSINNVARVGSTSSALDTAFDFIPGSGNQDYHLMVQAENQKTRVSTAVSGASSPSIHVISAAAPSAPESLIRTNSTSTSVTLSWSRPSDDGGAPIIKYCIRRNDGLGGTSFVDATSGYDFPTTTTYTVTALHVGYYYAFQVAGVNRALDSQIGGLEAKYSTVFFYAAAVPLAPPAPQLVSGSRSASGFIISWGIPQDSGGLPVLGYRLYRDNGAGDAIAVLLWNGEGQPHITSFSVTGLSGGSFYRFVVTAVNGAGESKSSPTLSLPAGTEPSSMGILQRDISFALSLNSVALTWSPPANDGGSPITGYLLRYDDGDYGEFVNVRNYSASTFGDHITSLPEGKFLRFIVHAENSVGLSPPSPVFRTQVCGASDPVANFVASKHTDTSVVLTWEPPANTGCRNALITSYKVYMRQGNNPYALVHEAGPSVLSFTKLGLSVGQRYVFKVHVCSAIDCNVSYPLGGLEVLAGRTPVFPSDAITLVSARTTELELRWVTPPGLPVDSYKLFFDAGSGTGGSISTQIYQGASPTFLKDTLATGVTYRFQVQATNQNGWGPLSGIASFVASLAPSVPKNLSYSSSTVQTLEVAWEEP